MLTKIQEGGDIVQENYIEAEKDYMAGMKYKDIASKYNTTINTVKSWKQRHDWSKDKKSVQGKGKKECIQNLKCAQIEDGTKQTLENKDLTPEQQLFCVYYIRNFNATQSYQKAYGCTYESALCTGSRLLGNARVKEEIQRLKIIRAQQIVASEADIVDLQMRIAFSSIENYVSFGQDKIKSENGKSIKFNTVDLIDSKDTDMQLIKKIKEGKDGVSIELEDKQKAIDWLTKYFLMHPGDKYKAEFDKKRVDVDTTSAEAIVKNMQTLADILRSPTVNRDIENYE